MTSEPAPLQQVPPYFLQEASELLQQMDYELQTLRQEFSIQKVHTLMRISHTLKGAASSVGLETIKTVTHSLEDTFKALCIKDAILSSAVEALIFDAYGCLQLLVSALLSKTKIDEASVLDRMANIVTQLQEHLGEQFGKDGYLPTSAELGFDVTQSIFEKGVNERLDQLEEALKTANPETLISLLKAQADIFIGLAESLNLPGFGEISQATLRAVNQHPENAIEIAQVALDDYRAGQARIFQGDRTHGGEPSPTLKALGQSSNPDSKNQLATQSQPTHLTSSKPRKPNPAQQFWNFVNRPIPGTPRFGKTQATSRSKRDSQTPVVSKVSVPINNSKSLKTGIVSRASEEQPHKPENTGLESFHEIENNIAETIVPINNSNIVEPEAISSVPINNSSIIESEAISSVETVDDITLPSKTNKADNVNTLRVAANQLESLNYIVGELLTQQNRQELHQNQLTNTLKALFIKLDQQQQQLYELQQKVHHNASINALQAHKYSSPQLTNYFDPLELEQYSDFQLLVQTSLDNIIQQTESVEAIELFTHQSHQTLVKQKQLFGGLRDTLFEIRMQPLEQTLQRFHQVITRLSHQYDKPVDLEIKIYGDNIRIDKIIADKLYEPLLHLVRNAFDHGIETLDLRQHHNKQDRGLITIEASQRGRYLTINVRDNGQGLNLEKICKKATENCLITAEEASKLTAEQLSYLIFEPEFSTVSQANDLSGRGIGLDVVRSQIYSLQGQVTVQSQLNQWTCFTLQIPTNLTIAKLLLFQTANKQYSIITDTIEKIVIPTLKQISKREQVKLLSWQSEDGERLVPIFSLSEILNYQAIFPDRILDKVDIASKTTLSALVNPIILIRYNEQIVGLEVDALQEEQELVIHSLGKDILTSDYIYGCNILPDGSLSLVLDGTVLVETILKGLSQTTIDIFKDLEQLDAKNLKSAEVSTSEKKSILIIDDSITVRNTLEITLQQAGYSVIQAKEGTEALKKLKNTKIDAIFCDLEMPGMNGFDFLKVCQQSSDIAPIPVIILSSRSSTKHQKLAEKLGAAAYLTKPYLAPQLLEVLTNALERATSQLQKV